MDPTKPPQISEQIRKETWNKMGLAVVPAVHSQLSAASRQQVETPPQTLESGWPVPSHNQKDCGGDIVPIPD